MSLLAGCEGVDMPSFGSGGTLAEGDLPDAVPVVPESELIVTAKQSYRDGNYGNAARYFEQAVEREPENGEAWLGLAASYDRLRRFDLADSAYRRAEKLIGDRFEYLNNRGYSYLLRGDLDRARGYFSRALEKSPGNVTIENNLEMIRQVQGLN